MAVASPSSTETLEPRPDKSDPDNPPSSSLLPASAPESSSSDPPSTDAPNPNPNPTPQALVTPLPPSLPSFRPLGIPPAPQYSTLPNPNVQNPGIQPPGVSAPFQVMPPGAQMRPMYQYAPGQPLPGAPMPYGQVQVPNGYMPMPSSQGPVMIPPPASSIGSW